MQISKQIEAARGPTPTEVMGFLLLTSVGDEAVGELLEDGQAGGGWGWSPPPAHCVQHRMLQWAVHEVSRTLAEAHNTQYSMINSGCLTSPARLPIRGHSPNTMGNV